MNMLLTLGLYRLGWPSQLPTPTATLLHRHIYKFTDVTAIYIDLIIMLLH